MELINFRLFVDFVTPLFEGKTFDPYRSILMVQSLANVILKKVWAKLIILRQKLLKEEENDRKQKERHQQRIIP